MSTPTTRLGTLIKLALLVLTARLAEPAQMPMLQIGINAHSKGMTLLETLVVISILAMLAVALPSLSASYSDTARLRDAAFLFADDLRTLQREAMATGSAASLEITNQGTTYVLRPSSLGRELPRGATVTFTPGIHQLARPDSGTLTFHGAGPSTGGSYAMSANGATHTVTVHWPTGQISYDE